MGSFREALWFTINQGVEVVDSARDGWKARHVGRRYWIKKRRWFRTERRSGWDRRARAATLPAWGSGPAW